MVTRDSFKVASIVMASVIALLLSLAVSQLLDWPVMVELLIGMAIGWGTGVWAAHRFTAVSPEPEVSPQD